MCIRDSIMYIKVEMLSAVKNICQKKEEKKKKLTQNVDKGSSITAKDAHTHTHACMHTHMHTHTRAHTHCAD